jgi:hypothetical protein
MLLNIDCESEDTSKYSTRILGPGVSETLELNPQLASFSEATIDLDLKYTTQVYIVRASLYPFNKTSFILSTDLPTTTGLAQSAPKRATT